MRTIPYTRGREYTYIINNCAIIKIRFSRLLMALAGFWGELFRVAKIKLKRKNNNTIANNNY